MTNTKSKIQPSHVSGSLVHPTGLPIIQQNDNLLISAQLLHRKLKVQTKYSTWLPRRIEKYGFREGLDFYPNLGKTSKKGGRPTNDYLLTVDMAKELAMLEENEIGRQIRRYFIQAEKAARAVSHLPKEHAAFKGLKRRRINDRSMLPYHEVKERCGYSTRSSSSRHRHTYWQHFVKEGNQLWVTEDFAVHLLHQRRVLNNRKAMKASQPVLSFGETKGGEL